MARKIILCILMACLGFASSVRAELKRGGLVLAFDDGHPSWVKVIAPELARMGGLATAFPDNRSIQNGRINFGELRILQNEFGWEIGTHTANHSNAPVFVERKGMSAWLSGELDAAVKDLRKQGLQIRSMVFPFNTFTPELARQVIKRFESYRRVELFPVARGVSPDGSIPGASIDVLHYTPIDLIKQWIDLAHEQDGFLFLYGHQVLPDEEFITGSVASVDQHELVADAPIRAVSKEELYLVPDTSRPVRNTVLKVTRIDGTAVHVGRGNVSAMTKPGAQFMIGPGYALRLSDFRQIIAYAASKLSFYTVHDAIGDKRR